MTRAIPPRAVRKRITPATLRDEMAILRGMELLKEARDTFNAAERVRLAISSAKGALRHVSTRVRRTASEKGGCRKSA